MRLLNDAEFLSRTIAGIYDCIGAPERWEQALVGLAETIGARRAFLGIASADGEMNQMLVFHNQGPLDEMLRHARYNPLLPLALGWPMDRAFVSSRDFGVEALRATRFHREYLAPRHDHDAIGFVVTREGHRFGHWLLVTPTGRGDITAEEVAGLELVAPHVRRAVEIANVLDRSRMAETSFRAALAELRAPVLLVEPDRRLVHGNPQALELLDRRHMLYLRQGRLVGATPSAAAALRSLERGRQSNSAALAAGFEATIADLSGGEHLMFGTRLREVDEAAAMLLIRSPREQTLNPVVVAARLYGLTQAQVQVAALLIQGSTPQEMTDILGVSLATIRSHLAELFRRTGTRSQAELVARILSAASPFSAREGGSLPGRGPEAPR